jgi:hypothetical protein
MILAVLIIFSITGWYFDQSIAYNRQILFLSSNPFNFMNKNIVRVRYRRQACSCTRPILNDQVTIDEKSLSLCSQYSTLRGAHQRIISISMFGPKENLLFALNVSLNFLRALIDDVTVVYPSWILRIYHDTSINNDIVCSIECAYNHVDFCNASALTSLGNISSYMPPKIWRFLPAVDPSVDIMASRDLDSPLTSRELAAVNQWLLTNKSWHAMRDHPLHTVPMLGKTCS